MRLQFLIDECLSPSLTKLAHAAGYNATSVRDRGWAGLKDQQLMKYVIAEDLTLVTNNARDFRGPTGGPLAGLHSLEEIHAGLICLTRSGNVPLGMLGQRALFQIALDSLPADLVNKAIEVSEAEDGSVTINCYDIPSL
ncbi:DUF5615 family PIN-like protein [Pseudomonas sp. R5(2019)]|uniref:DUF5615 family PIN-like protein n=1 Tax=Pseudomonas sp. R5(2019) TaxID=2697566 RepID=UPI0014131620|nr:DUF5615 family PIN-like protein [Pseudomonas sp. R5(2019)]NBA95975.1 hypothetical protein [Pseudomonas sp. R5(2019)]